MDEEAVAFAEGLKQHFRELTDPRVENRCDHRLIDIVAIVMLGMLAGAENWPDFKRCPDAASSCQTSSRTIAAGLCRR